MTERGSHLMTPAHWGWMLACSTLFMLLFIDALRHPYAFFDVGMMKAIQRVELTGLATYTHALDDVTGSEGSIAAWAVVLLTLAIRLRWAAVLATALMPLGGLVNLVIGEGLVARTRPHLPDLERGSMTWSEPSFPSGHVEGAVLLYGFLFIVASQLSRRSLRLPLQAACLVVVVTVGPARIWDGAHWPTDVISGYALGGMFLVGLVVVETGLREVIDGLPPTEAIRRVLRLLAEKASSREVEQSRS